MPIIFDDWKRRKQSSNLFDHISGVKVWQQDFLCHSPSVSISEGPRYKQIADSADLVMGKSLVFTSTE